jgi:putative membrane protein
MASVLPEACRNYARVRQFLAYERFFRTSPQPAHRTMRAPATPPATADATVNVGGGWWRSGVRNGVVLGALVGLAFLGLWNAGLHDMAGVIRDVPACVAISTAVHLPQLVLTGIAWRILMPKSSAPSIAAMTVLRWFRESAGTLVPGGGLLGQVAAARLLMRRGVTAIVASASAAVDITNETVSQAIFTMFGLALLIDSDESQDVVIIAAVGTALIALGAVFMVMLPRLARRPRFKGRLGRLGIKLPAKWQQAIAGVHAAVLALHAEPGRLVLAVGAHLAAWLIGAAEFVAVLGLLGRHVRIVDGLIIESIAQALRSAGFLLPGAAGVQEGAIVAAAALVGIPAGPALTAALVRRTREVLMAVPGLLLWRRAEATAALTPAGSA